MSSSDSTNASGDLLLEMRGLRIEGQSGEQWQEIIKGMDITLRRGEVLVVDLEAPHFEQDGALRAGFGVSAHRAAHSSDAGTSRSRS